MSHFKEVCKYCGTLITQCRCPSKDKEIKYGVCATCKIKPKKMVTSSIELAEDEKTIAHEAEINVIVYMLGHEDALVTDLSTVRDFAPTIETVEKLSEMLEYEVDNNSLIIDLAIELRKLRNTLGYRK